MINKKNAPICKSSRHKPLLLLFLLIVLAKPSDAALVNDTIILGGKRLLIERELSYDTLGEKNQEEEAPSKKTTVKRRKFDDWRIGFEVSPSLTVQQFTSNAEGLMTLSEAGIGTTNPGSAMGLSLTVERKIKTGNGAIWLSLAPGIDYFNAPSPHFDVNQLSDSLYGFHYYGDGRLGQVTRFRYPIGAEFDTLEVQLTRQDLRTSWLSLPIGVLFERSVNKKMAFRFGGGLNFRLRIDEERPGILLLPKTGIDYLQLPETSNLWAYRMLTFTPWLQGSLRYALDRNWGLNMGLRVAFPLNETADNVWFERQSVALGVALGLSYSLGK
jgi:hypothetical protein